MYGFFFSIPQYAVYFNLPIYDIKKLGSQLFSWLESNDIFQEKSLWNQILIK